MTYPLPVERMRAFAESVDRCVVIEEGDPYLVEAARTAGIAVEGKPEMYPLRRTEHATACAAFWPTIASPEPKRVAGQAAGASAPAVRIAASTRR